MTGMSTARATARVSAQSKPLAAAVAVHAGEQYLPRPAPSGPPRPGHGIDARGHPAAVHVDLPFVARARNVLRVDGAQDGLAAERGGPRS